MSTVEVIGSYVEFIYCGCGCGETTSKYVMSRGKPLLYMPKKFKYRHQNIGRPLPISQATRMKMSEAKMGNNNYKWGGDEGGDISYDGLHKWVRRHFWPTRLCQRCMEVPPYDLTNITNIYNRDFRNWRYYCRRCHVESDGRLTIFLSYRQPFKPLNG